MTGAAGDGGGVRPGTGFFSNSNTFFVPGDFLLRVSHAVDFDFDPNY